VLGEKDVLGVVLVLHQHGEVGLVRDLDAVGVRARPPFSELRVGYSLLDRFEVQGLDRGNHLLNGSVCQSCLHFFPPFVDESARSVLHPSRRRYKVSGRRLINRQKKSDPAVRGRDRNGNYRMPRKELAFGQVTPRRASLNVQPGAYCAALTRYIIRTKGNMLPG